MADQLKQHQKSALQLLETAAFHIKSTDKAVSVLAALAHVWLHRRVLVSAEFILPSITNALEARVPVTSGWLSEAAGVLSVLELTDALTTPEQAVGDWLTKIGTGGAKGPLGRGLALADADLLREVFPPALERQRLVDKLVLAAGRPTAPAQAAIVNVLSYIWAENIDNVQVRVLHAMSRPDYTNWLVSDLKSDVQTVATYFSTKIAGLAASDKVKPADAQAALETATSALLDHIRAVSAASATPPTVVAAVDDLGRQGLRKAGTEVDLGSMEVGRIRERTKIAGNRPKTQHCLSFSILPLSLLNSLSLCFRYDPP